MPKHPPVIPSGISVTPAEGEDIPPDQPPISAKKDMESRVKAAEDQIKRLDMTMAAGFKDLNKIVRDTDIIHALRARLFRVVVVHYVYVIPPLMYYLVKCMTEISVTSKGQITIPAHLRKKHNIDETSKVEVVEENGKLVINKLVTIFDLAGTGDGDPETIKRELDQLRETDAKSSSL